MDKMSKRKFPGADHQSFPLKLIKLNSEINETLQVVNVCQANVTSKTADSNVAETPEEISFEGLRESLIRSLKQVSKIHRESQSWSSNIIDIFKLYVESQHGFKSDFIFFGQCIESVAKVYALRIESLLKDTKKLCISLGRGLAAIEQEEETEEETGASAMQDVVVTKKKRRNLSTVSTSLQALNAKLDTHPLSDPFFSMLDSFVGETSRADRMLLNLLPAKSSGHQIKGISSNAPYWSKLDQVQVKSSRESVSLNITDCHNIETQTIRSSKFEIFGDDIKLISLVDICDDSETDDDVDMDLQIDQVETSLKFSSFQENNVGDRTQDTGYGTAMDVTQGCSMVSNVLVTRQLNDLNSANIFEPEIELEEDEELQFVEDFHPLSDQVLEYSYRSLVKNYYAGPSHWKYMKKTINKKSQTGQRRIKSKKISIEDLKILDTATENFLIKDKISSKKFSISQKKMKNWLLKKLKLPRNFHVSFLIFDRFSYANFGLDEKVEDFNALRENEFNLEGHFDEDVVMHEQNITTDFSKHDVVFLKPLRDNLKQPRKIDVKAIKEISLAVIRNESEGGNTNVKFSVVDKKVSKMFEQGQTSCALNFLVLLQATNDEKIELVQIDDNIFDFDIKYRFES